MLGRRSAFVLVSQMLGNTWLVLFGVVCALNRM